MNNVAVIIPSLNPDKRLCELLLQLSKLGFEHIVVVDDGSSDDCRAAFPAPGKISGCILLRHEVNRGKGAALKTAFAYLMHELPELDGAVTADGDGQHTPEDILACANEMLRLGNRVILGVRDFKASNVPKRSRRGNHITSAVFKLAFGMTISDTQTGLRAFPMQYLPLFCKTEGDRYEYETNQLISMKRNNIQISELKIATVYLDGNKASHFHVVRDSIRIYSRIFKFMASSLVSSLIDIVVFYLLEKLLVFPLGNAAELVSTIIARIVSSGCNFAINRHIVFKDSTNGALIRYYLLAVCQMTVSGCILTILNLLFRKPGAEAVTAIKLVVDCALFFVSYYIQRKWVFAPHKDKRKE